MNTQIL
ncbi:hypothetical protein EYF80_063670 [Liparis tanakae]|nr:hypothetical protein EYF80_063670 [Liparis tanakae]